MEVDRRHLFCLQELGNLFGLPSSGAVHDGTARLIRRQIRCNNLMDVSVLLAAGRPHNHKLQVGSLRAAIKDLQFNTEFITEIVHDFRLHIGLGGRG